MKIKMTMAKAKPKLGDVRRWLKDLSMVHRYCIKVFYRRRWNHHAWATNKEDAKLKERALRGIFSSIIREARDNGVNDAIAAVRSRCNFCNDGDSGDVDADGASVECAYCGVPIRHIRDETGVKP